MMMRRREFIGFAGKATLGWPLAAGLMLPYGVAFARNEQESHFIAEAARMKSEAVASGDQPFGAVLAKAGAIVGYGPSRVTRDRNPDAHAERVALWDAQKRLGTKDMTETVMYSTSRPCALCERALAIANVERMYVGPAGTEAGRPRSP
jgi:tRNA(Arg) A34 adenosine deaminase TadA